jgi:protein-S-isoprenylcysteine O-methyltransferase Ste14
MVVGAPRFHGSIRGILAGLDLTLLLMARIRGEEASLRRDLEEYREYTLNVRYRHFPCIWQGRLLKKTCNFSRVCVFF